MKSMAASTAVERRMPQQERSSKRVAEYLEVAANLFNEVGYDAATMSAVAERAGSSIGGLYRYFPDKQSLALELRTRYGSEIDSVMTGVIHKSKDISVAELSHQLLDTMAKFISERPGYFTLLTAPINYRIDPAAYNHLITQLSKAFLAKNSILSQSTVAIAANVAFHMVKGMVEVCANVEPRRRASAVREFERAMTNYLTDVLQSK